MAAREARRRQPGFVHVLDADRDLAGGLDREQQSLARQHAVARLLTVERGVWRPPRFVDSDPAFLGLLLLEGLLVRDVLIAGIGCAELIGKGDLLHPWDQYEGEPSVRFDVEYHAVEPTQLAVLDGAFAAAVSRWPTVTALLTARAARLAHSIAAHFAITCLVGLERRLYILFWHLADRFGTAERDGVVVPLPLTHETLGRLVRARRPSVTASLRHLAAENLVARREDGSWLVAGDPREQFERMTAGRVGDGRTAPDGETAP